MTLIFFLKLALETIFKCIFVCIPCYLLEFIYILTALIFSFVTHLYFFNIMAFVIIVL